ncbi:MAG: aspartate/glutamate racemase family protein [Pseudomonadota bacterium]
MTHPAGKFLFLMPVPMSPEALSSFAAQLPVGIRRENITIDFSSPDSGASLLDTPYDSVIAEATVMKAGLNAEEAGYDLICAYSMSDSGVKGLRSRLNIPVIGAGEATFHLAAQLGKKFSVITMWEPWYQHSHDLADKTGLQSRLASVRHINVRPDTQELLKGKEDIVFGKLEEAANQAIAEDGADVIVLGSTTMNDSHAYLESVLDCPVVNPGQAAYKTCEIIFDLKLTHSKTAHPTPPVLNDAVFGTPPSLKGA